ncbi:MAG TPA: methenyltetrahydromethanopterin cyclohydrolase [Clostridia bacterium]|nr:methenyltetrahydromethanopterin cyclohydrolase [Clostridia bacterium]
MLSVNRQAYEIVQTVIKEAPALRVGVFTLRNGATVIDMGVECAGGFKAAEYFTLAGMGGLGSVRYEAFDLDGYILPAVRVYVWMPAIACLSSHVAGWSVRSGEWSPIVAGPIRSIRGVDVFSRAMSYRDQSDVGVVTLQMPRLPDEDLAEAIAQGAGIDPRRLYILVAKTASIVGSVQVPARSVEQIMPKLFDLGFDVTKVTAAMGVAPIAPLCEDELKAIGRVNDCILYGVETHVWADCEDEEIVKILNDAVLCTKDRYGTPFEEIFRDYGYDFFKVPRELDSPARIVISNIRTGRVFSAGVINRELLKRSLLK